MKNIKNTYNKELLILIKNNELLNIAHIDAILENDLNNFLENYIDKFIKYSKEQKEYLIKDFEKQKKFIHLPDFYD